jgi:hypothetical protein
LVRRDDLAGLVDPLSVLPNVAFRTARKSGSSLNRSFGAGLVSRLIRYFGTSRRQLSGGSAGIGLRSSVAVVVGMVILIVATPQDQHLFEPLPGDGSELGVHFTYPSQDKPRGLADAFVPGADFVGSDRVTIDRSFAKSH